MRHELQEGRSEDRRLSASQIFIDHDRRSEICVDARHLSSSQWYNQDKKWEYDTRTWYQNILYL